MGGNQLDSSAVSYRVGLTSTHWIQLGLAKMIEQKCADMRTVPLPRENILSGAKMNVTVAGSLLRLTDPETNLEGEYEFDHHARRPFAIYWRTGGAVIGVVAAPVDMGTVKTRRGGGVQILEYVANEPIGSRGQPAPSGLFIVLPSHP